MKLLSRRDLFIIFVVLLAAYALPQMIQSLQFASGPAINVNSTTIYTMDDLVCAWTPSADTTAVNVSWFRNGVRNLTVTPSANFTTLHNANTTKGDTWHCEVTLYNATSSLGTNVSVNISNTAQTVPVLHNVSRNEQIPNNYSLIEDTAYSFFINSTDADGDTLSYSINPDAGGLCVVVSASTGQTTCTATHEIITGSSSDGPETATNKTLTLRAEASNPLVVVGDENRTFWAVPQNDQASFVQNPQNATVSAETSWYVKMNGSDEETDYNLTWTLASTLDASFPGLLVIANATATSMNITFNTSGNMPSNAHVGNWTVNVNVTDNTSYNGTRPPTQRSFALQIIPNNHAPNFTSSFNNSNGTQGQLFTLSIYANDTSGDTVQFNITNPPGSNSCAQPFPWNITTTNTSALNATGTINVTLNNTHVVCRYANITVYDQLGAQLSYIAFFNITNVNDAPTLHEIGLDGNLSNKTGQMLSAFLYRLNASDSDNLTYDAANTGILAYYSNSSMFPVNSSTGFISVTPSNASFVGNWTINYTVGDGQYNSSRIMVLEILNNSAPVLNLTQNNLTFSQNDAILVNFTGLELNNETMNVTLQSLASYNSSIYNITSLSNDYSGGQNLETFMLNATAANAAAANTRVGNHSVRIVLSDQYGSSVEGVSTGTLAFTIANVDDAPFFDQNQDNASDTTTLNTIIVGLPYNQTFYFTDFDFYIPQNLSNENLSFSYENASSGVPNITFSRVNGTNTSALLSLLANESGMHTIALKATDANGSVAFQNFTFQVFQNSSPPSFEQIRPYYNSTINNTIFAFANATLFNNSQVSINFTENTTVVFDAVVSNDTGIAANYLDIKWYYDGTLNKTVNNSSIAKNSNLTVYFDFFMNGTRNITMEAIDSRLASSTWTWLSNVSDLNRPPTYTNFSMDGEDYEANFTTEFANFFSFRNGQQRFYDADEDLDGDGIRSMEDGENSTLNYTINGESSCSIATLTISDDNLIVAPEGTGICQFSFNATDPYGFTVISDIVLITLNGAEPSDGSDTPSSQSGGSSSSTRVITVPFPEEIDVPKPITIVTPGVVNTYLNRTIEIPIIIKNTWNETVRGITLTGLTLNATIAQEENVSLEFSRTFFSAVPVGGEVYSTLIVSNYRTEGPFDIKVTAMVQDPSFEDSATILINSLEQTQEGEQVRTKVTFARDLLSENPECKELNELVDRAERALASADYEEAAKLADAVINGCKYLLNEQQLSRKEKPGIVSVAYEFIEKNADKVIIGTGVLTVLTIVFYMLVGIKRMIDEMREK